MVGSGWLLVSVSPDSSFKLTFLWVYMGVSFLTVPNREVCLRVFRGYVSHRSPQVEMRVCSGYVSPKSSFPALLKVEHAKKIQTHTKKYKPVDICLIAVAAFPEKL